MSSPRLVNRPTSSAGLARSSTKGPYAPPPSPNLPDAPEPGDDWQLPAPPGVPDPEATTLPESPMSQFASMSPFEMRPVNEPVAGGFPVIHPFWVRTRRRLPDDPALHTCVLTFMSDMG